MGFLQCLSVEPFLSFSGAFEGEAAHGEIAAPRARVSPSLMVGECLDLGNQSSRSLRSSLASNAQAVPAVLEEGLDCSAVAVSQ